MQNKYLKDYSGGEGGTLDEVSTHTPEATGYAASTAARVPASLRPARLDHRREGREAHEVEFGRIGGHLLRAYRFQALEPVVVNEPRQVHHTVAV